jgi:twitching motility protein PilT
VPNPAVRALIRDDKVHQIYSIMQVGQEKSGMITLNQSLAQLVKRRLITMDEAFSRTSDLEELAKMLGIDPKSIGQHRPASKTRL